ncbi:hypothetical protein INN71_16945 [Nocardioides sp. ChNu-153]|uniref:hypothetical protein n=1 Tax=unclassified Nocardioides TaxID=2615069 RepID=UPI0024051804|nr:MULTISPECIES: hypothetical protein [unclassified Nocardioides]MDF9716637.1 hypothetical protein [Nocardioides sp. ChNu-99]MDN7123074.1 hypothetical protein [Nocardioides sp. ChNu-153]
MAGWRSVTVVVAAVGLVLGGCTADEEPARSADPCPPVSAPVPSRPPEVDASVVRGLAGYDYEPFPTLTAAVEEHDVAVSGRVRGWSDGGSVRHGRYRRYFAVLTVDVEHATKTLDPTQREVAHVVVERGMEPVDADGAPVQHTGRSTPTPVPTVEEYERATPAGARVLVIGSPPDDAVPEPTPPADAGPCPGSGPPAGAPLVRPALQGFLVETTSGGFDSMVVEVADLEHWARHAAELAGSDATTPGTPGSYQVLVEELRAATR